METNAKKIEYVVFDFDLTLSAYHLHSECVTILSHSPANTFAHKLPLLTDQIETWEMKDINLLWQALKDQNKLIPTGEANDWRQILMTLIQQDFLPVIASFSSFPPIIKRFLEEIIGIPHAYLRRIPIEAWLPSDQGNKNRHLDRILIGAAPDKPINLAIQELDDDKRKALYPKLILIDDTLQNIQAVIRLTSIHHAILVPRTKQSVPQLLMPALNKLLGIHLL